MTERCPTVCHVFTVIAGLAATVSYAQDVVISEVMFNPSGDENACEYVELLNRGSASVSLEGYAISDSDATDLLVPIQDDGWTVAPGGLVLIVDPDYFDSPDRYPVPDHILLFTVPDRAIGNRGLSNSVAEPVLLIDGDGDTCSQVTYDLDTPPGHSWERVLPDGDDQPSNFAPSLIQGGTPGAPNSVLPPPLDPALDALSLSISPSSPQYGESLTVSLSYLNTGRDTTSQVTFSLSLPTLTPVTMVFDEPVPPGDRSPVRQALFSPLPGGRLSLAAVITTGNTITTTNDTLRLTLSAAVDPGILILNEIMAAPSEDEPEWIELFNTGDWPVVLDSWRIGDSGSASDSVTADICIPSGGFGIITGSGFSRDVPDDMPVMTIGGFPSLNNDGDTVRLFDWTGAVADSMTYEQTEPGLSLELISPELRGTSAGWDVCVDPDGATPGEANSIDYPPSGVENGDDFESPELTIDPNPFGDLTTLSYSLPFPLARVRLTVYDRRGRLIDTLRDTEESGSSWSGTWDGRSNGGKLPAGPYILNLEVLDKRTGTTHTERTVIVIGSQL